MNTVGFALRRAELTKPSAKDVGFLEFLQALKKHLGSFQSS